MVYKGFEKEARWVWALILSLFLDHSVDHHGLSLQANYTGVTGDWDSSSCRSKCASMACLCPRVTCESA